MGRTLNGVKSAMMRDTTSASRAPLGWLRFSGASSRGGGKGRIADSSSSIKLIRTSVDVLTATRHNAAVATGPAAQDPFDDARLQNSMRANHPFSCFVPHAGCRQHL